MANTRIKHLKELSNSDYKIADDQPDIDNWKIVDGTGKKVGKVKDLLFDEEAKRVRYIITDLNDGEILKEDRRVLIPIGQARLNREDERVVVANITRENLSGLPAYKNVDNLTQEDEYAIRNSISGAGATADATGAYNRETFYKHEDFNEDKFYNENLNTGRNTGNKDKVDVIEEDVEVGKREVETGGAKITSRIVERPVEERVNLREEHVKVNRNPVDRPASSADLDNFEEGTVEMKEKKEVPVVNKEARVKEEITLDKEVENREEVVKENVRKTKVDVDRPDADTGRMGANKTAGNKGTTGNKAGNIDKQGNRENLNTGNRGTDDIRDTERRDRDKGRKI